MAKTQHERTRRTTSRILEVLPLLLLALCLLAPSLALAAKTKSVDNPADAPVRRLQTMLTRKNTSVAALHKVETELEQARSAKPDGLNGAKATFFLARTQQEIALRGGKQADWVKAANTFGACAERFPKYQLAPDALLHRGTIRLQRLADYDGAQADFTAIQHNYPRSQHAATAAKLLQRIPKNAAAGKKAAPSPSAPPAVTAQDAQPDSGRAGDDKPQLLDVRPKNNGAAARIVLDLDSHVRYRYQILEHKSGKPKGGRIYVDLLGARPRSGLADDLKPTGGILRHIRVAPKDADSTRVVMAGSAKTAPATS